MEYIHFTMQKGHIMTQEYQLETILAHAGINSDEATGALASPIHFSTTYQHPEFGHSTGFDYTRTKKHLQLLKKQIMLLRQVQG